MISVNPSEKDPKSTHIDVALTPGRALTGTVVDPAGQPLADAHGAGLGATPKFFDRSEGKLATANFTVSGLNPKKSRSVLFIHPEKKLAKLMTIRPDEPGPLTMRLEPTGTLAGRVVDATGKPLAGLKVAAQLSFKPEDTKDLPAELRFNYPTWSKLTNGVATTGKDGKFRVDGLIPGLRYNLMVNDRDPQPGKRAVAYVEDLSVESSKTKDLGDLKGKASAKEE